MSRKMDISHQRLVISIRLQTGGDILHILSLTCALGGETHQFATSIDDTLCLCHTALGIVSVHRRHRLDADGILSSNADIPYTSLSANSSIVHIYDLQIYDLRFNWS